MFKIRCIVFFNSICYGIFLLNILDAKNLGGNMNKYRDKNYYFNIVRINIRKYRKEKGLTQKMLAEKINYSVGYINEIESLSKRKSFSILMLGRIADILEIDIKDFFNN